MSEDAGITAQVQLTEREMMIATVAAKMAVKEISDEFYKQVGKTFISKVLIWVGVAVVAFAAGKGWISIPTSNA